MRVKVQTE